MIVTFVDIGGIVFDHTCLYFHFKIKLGGRARMLVGVRPTYVISAYHH
jgi:hypothetical protein